MRGTVSICLVIIAGLIVALIATWAFLLPDYHKCKFDNQILRTNNTQLAGNLTQCRDSEARLKQDLENCNKTVSGLSGDLKKCRQNLTNCSANLEKCRQDLQLSQAYNFYIKLLGKGSIVMLLIVFPLEFRLLSIKVDEKTNLKKVIVIILVTMINVFATMGIGYLASFLGL